MNDDKLFTELGVIDALPALPDDVWERALSVALDPTTPPVDADLVPEMDDLPVIPDDEDEIVLYDMDEAPPAAGPDTAAGDGADPGHHHDLDDTGDAPLGHHDDTITVHDDPTPIDSGHSAVDGDDPGLGHELGHDLF